VKAGCGKTARPVWAADGGQRLGNRARLLRPDTKEAFEQGLWCAIICGGSRGKGVGQGESGSAKQGPHSVAGSPVTCAGTDTVGVRSLFGSAPARLT